MARKLYGSARAVSNIGSLQIGTSSYPAVSAVNKATFISKINSTKAVRDNIIANGNITGASFEITQSGSNWNGYVAIDFGGTIVKSGATGVSVDAAVAFLESWGGTVITPVSSSLYSPLTLTDITYHNGTRKIKKLYSSVNGQTKEVERLYGSVNGVSKLIYKKYPTFPYGKLTYYTGTIEGYGAGPETTASVYSIDQTKVPNFFDAGDAKITDHTATLWGQGSSMWSYETNSSGWVQISNYQLKDLYGIDIYGASGTKLDLKDNIAINGDPTSQTATVILPSQADVDALSGPYTSGEGKSITVAGINLILGQVKEFVGGYSLTTIPSSFLDYTSLTKVDLSDSPITTIPASALSYIKTNFTVYFPESVETISTSVLLNCPQFNSPVSFPASLRTVGTRVLSSCPSFNSPVTFNGPVTLGERFLSTATSFNQPIDLTNVTLGTYFLEGATSFNSPITNLPAVISYHFLASCKAFNKPLDLTGVTTIEDNFLDGCVAFNQNITIPSSVTSIGAYMMCNCSSMTSTVTWETDAIAGASSSNYSFSVGVASAACYVTGITFDGPFAAYWASLYYNRTMPYRKILCASLENTYGTIHHYGYSQAWTDEAWNQNTNWTITNQSAFDAFVQQNGGSENNIFYFNYTGTNWTVWIQKTSQSVTISDPVQQTGISLTPKQGGFSSGDGMGLAYGYKVDKSVEYDTPITSASDYAALQAPMDAGYPKEDYVFQLSTRDVFSNAIVRAVIGNIPTSIPDRFLACSRNMEIIAIGQNITSVGEYVLFNCGHLRGALKFPNVTTVGHFFCAQNGYNNSSSDPESYSQFNAEIEIPLATSIGNYFLYNAYNFNKLLSLPEATSIGSHFLGQCRTFNQSLLLASATSLGEAFLYKCSSFNKSLSLTNVTTIGNRFMRECTTFNQTITAPVLTTIGDYFMAYCSAFSRSLSFPKLETIGSYFYYQDTALNMAPSLPTTLTTIGNYFMNNCTAFNKGLTIPSSVTSIGTYFMYCCNAMTATLTVRCAATVALTSNYTLATTSNTAACYTTGIKLGGAHKNEWHSRFADSSSTPYRKTTVS